MAKANLFRLRTDLETGAARPDDDTPHGHLTVVADPRLADFDVAATGAPDRRGRDPFDAARDDHFIRRDGETFAGLHLIIEVTGGEGLDDEARIRAAFRDCVAACGATLLHIHTHKFSPQGVSGVAVLAESHISVHTWPEIGYGAFDVFMCGDATPWNAVAVLRDAFSAADVRVSELRRGAGLVA